MKKIYIKQDFDDIKALYPNQWVGLADFEMEGFQIKSAYLLCAGKSKMDATKQLSKLIARTDFENYSVEWVGEPIQKPTQEIVSIVLKTT